MSIEEFISLWSRNSYGSHRFCYLILLVSYMALCLATDQTPAANGIWDVVDHDSCQLEQSCGLNIWSTLSCDVNLFHGQGSPCYSGVRNICCKTMSPFFPPLFTTVGIREDLHIIMPLCWMSPSGLLESNSTWGFCQMSLDLLKYLIVDSFKGEMHGNLVLNMDGNRNGDASLASHRNDNSEVIDAGLFHCFSTPDVLIDPPLLDWGTNYLYVPSFAVLTITNTCNHSILTIYEISSTSAQFFAYNVSGISVEPGKYAALPVVFLPRWLGLSSTQLVMETSFGGFLINAKGSTIEPPYKIEPLIKLIFSSNRSLRTKLSIYNPFDYIINVKEVQVWSLSIYAGLVHFTCAVCPVGTSYTTDGVDSLHFEESCFLKNERLGGPPMEIMPKQKWEVSIHISETFMDIEPLARVNGHIFWAFCKQLQSSDSQNWSDLVIVPLEEEVDRVAYYSPTGLVYVSIEVLGSCTSSNSSSFVLSLRNDASHLLSLTEVNEVGGSAEVFQVHYWKGLLLYPAATTYIALVTHTFRDSVPPPEEIMEMTSGCMLQIVTNYSGGAVVEIPCHDLVLHTCSYHQINSSSDDSGNPVLEATSQDEITKLGSSMTGLLGNIFQVPSPFEVSGIKDAKGLILRNQRSQGTSEDMTLLEGSDIVLPAVQVGKHSSKKVAVSNPSQYPVIMQLILNPSSVVNDCQDSVWFLTHPLVDDAGLVDGFHDIFVLLDSAITEVHVPPIGKAFLGPIFFRPSNMCEWRSTAYMRNNISGVEVLSISGFGGSPSLIFLEGSHPVRSLEFNLNVPIPSAVSWSGLVGMKNQDFICSQSLSKELLAKNIGKLPMEIRKVGVSGIGCGSDGFRIHTCKDFALAPGESKIFLISFQTDYSAPVVHRELVLDIAGCILVVPMTAILPLDVLNICWKSYLRILWKIFMVVVAAVSLMSLFYWIHPKVSESKYEDRSGKSGLNSTAAMHIIQSVSHTFEKQKSQRYFDCSASNARGGLPAPQLKEFPFNEDKVSSALDLSGKKMVCLGGNHVSAEQGTAIKLTVDIEKERPGGKSSGVPLGLVEKLEALCGQSGKSVPSSPKSPLLLSSTPGQIPEPADCEFPSECHSSVVIKEAGNAEAGNLTVKTGANRRRRKKRASGNSLKGKFDTSSSQSGNSTPSSPLSPSVSHMHRRTPLSPDNEQLLEFSPPRKLPGDSRQDRVLKATSTSKLWGPEVFKYYGKASSHLSKEQPSSQKKNVVRPAFLPSATFPVAGWCASSTLASNTKTPFARAPGYQAGKDKLKDGNTIGEKRESREEFTYDIWGSHFPEPMMDKSVKTLTKALDDESLSFFLRGP